ncbi:MAG: BamA/TamA family outer membrane protein, partial [Pseudomonadota bacterium]
RNVAGKAETLTVSATAKTNQIGLGLDYNIPYFMQWQRSLALQGEVAREDTDAFTGERASAGFIVSQRLSSNFSVGLGGGLEASQFDQDGTNTTAYLFEGLGRATFDSRDDILDARKGVYVEARAIPVFNFGEEEGFFASIETGVSAYQSLSETLTLATRIKAGSLFGADQDTVPLNRRFYGGGGGSVRGFGFQSISPVNAAGDVIGGRSITEVSTEVRYKGESNFGAALFIDAASVGADDWPGWSDVRYGAGIGVRYHTPFAPLRADIAIPLNKRPQDDDFQIYISIGQAF